MLIGTRPVAFQGLTPRDAQNATSQQGQFVSRPNAAGPDVVQFSAARANPYSGESPLVKAHLDSFPAFGPPPFNAAFHADRRQQFINQLPPNTTVIVPGAGNVPRNGDVNHAFRQESNLYYLTGFDEPETVAILSNVPGRPAFTLIVPPRDPAKEVWTGRRAGTEGALNTYGANAAFNNTDLNAVLKETAQNGGKVTVLPAISNPDLNRQIGAYLKRNLEPAQTLGSAGDVENILDNMRLIKTPYEIALLKRACQISAEGHMNAMKRAKLTEGQQKAHPAHAAGRNEGEVQAEVEYDFRRKGAVRVGYGTIAGGGANGCVLHYETNREFAQPKDLVLVDAGAEYGYYTSDLTRTWPVAGKFSPEQKAIYDLVLDAQESGIRMTKPGTTLKDIHANSVKVITEGLVKLGVLKGDPAQLIADRAYAPYFMHGTSHMLGMDVHDVVPKQPTLPDSVRPGQGLPLAPGMFFTVEPGIYIDPDVAKANGVDPKWWGIGVRIEDDILVTPTGYENFTEAAPRTTADIEAFMAKARGRVS